MDDLLSAQYVIALDNSEPSNYTMVPNIIDHLTYDEIDKVSGEIKIKRLSVYAKELYRVLRLVGGSQNMAWKNTENLADMCNMSPSQICKSKKELLQKFHELEGCSLIEITEKKKTTRDFNGDKLNGTIYHQISIRNIWGMNRAFFLMKKLLKESLSEGAHSHSESAGVAHSHSESALEGAHSHSERNKTTCSNTPLFKEQDSTAGAVSVCTSSKEDSVKAANPQLETFNWLTSNGCNVIQAVEISKAYPSQEIKKAIDYTEKAIVNSRKKMKSIGKPMAYLVKTLENRYWETQKA